MINSDFRRHPRLRILFLNRCIPGKIRNHINGDKFRFTQITRNRNHVSCGFVCLLNLHSRCMSKKLVYRYCAVFKSSSGFSGSSFILSYPTRLHILNRISFSQRQCHRMGILFCRLELQSPNPWQTEFLGIAEHQQWDDSASSSLLPD